MPFIKETKPNRDIYRKSKCILDLRGAFNKFPDFFVQVFRIDVNSWKFSMLLLYVEWDDWPIFMISGSNQQLQQQLEYTLLKPNCHSWWISKMQSGREEERYAIKICFKLGKNAMRWKLDLLLWPRDQETEFPVEVCWLSQTQEGQTEQIHPPTFDNPFFDSTGMIYMHWVPTGLTVNKEYYVEVLREFRKRFRRKRPEVIRHKVCWGESFQPCQETSCCWSRTEECEFRLCHSFYHETCVTPPNGH